LRLSLERARQVAVAAQLLSARRPTGMLEVIEHLGGLQMDPIRAVERTERLVLWSRLGAYDVAELDRARFGANPSLFEYWAFILPLRDFGIHRETMRRRAAANDTLRARRRREWLTANASFRRYVKSRLRREGPLRSSEFEDRAAVPWESDRWWGSRDVGRMLEYLWDHGEITTVGRESGQRVWDLAERRYPLKEPRLPATEVARRVFDQQLRSLGLVRPSEAGVTFGDRVRGWERAVRNAVRDGLAVPVTVEGVRGEFLVHVPTLEKPFAPRTTLLSPFDRLVWDRRRTEELFGFRFRVEIYVPAAQRQYGYYVMPVLDGDRLIGRIDPLFDRRTGVLEVRAVHAEPDAPAKAGPRIAESLQELASWLGAERIALGRRLPSRWRAALRAAS